MQDREPFGRDDLDELDERLLSRAAKVVALEDVFDGERGSDVIGLRHDCDSRGSLETATHMAAWEAERGYRSTYYILHSAPYWDQPDFAYDLADIAACGHEIGIHVNALAESLRTGDDPDLILHQAIGRLRDLGYRVRGAAGHGDAICIRDKAEWEAPFANDEQFADCRRERMGQIPREINRGSASLLLQPRPLAEFGLEYEALSLGLPHPFRCSDSGGRWFEPGFDAMVNRFADPGEQRQLHLLIHPDWWQMAFAAERSIA